MDSTKGQLTDEQKLEFEIEMVIRDAGSMVGADVVRKIAQRVLAVLASRAPRDVEKAAEAASAASAQGEAQELIQAERVKSRLLGMEDAISAFSDESLIAENKTLHEAIEQFWGAQCGKHACGCDEWPECVHTINAAALRRIAIDAELAAHPAPVRVEERGFYEELNHREALARQERNKALDALPREYQGCAAQPAAPVASESVVEAMLKEFTSAANGTDGNLPTMKERMTAALHVAADRLLCPVNEEDRKAWLQTPLTSSPALTMRSELDANVIFANRYARISAKKTVEESVTVKENMVYGGGCLIAEFHGTFGFSGDEAAQKYAEELRAKLRESEDAK